MRDHCPGRKRGLRSSSLATPGWDVINGKFGGSFSGDGVYSIPSMIASDAAYALPVSSDGNFDLAIPFTLNNAQSLLYVGLSTASSAQDTSGWTVIGNGPDTCYRIATAA